MIEAIEIQMQFGLIYSRSITGLFKPSFGLDPSLRAFYKPIHFGVRIGTGFDGLF